MVPLSCRWVAGTLAGSKRWAHLSGRSGRGAGRAGAAGSAPGDGAVAPVMTTDSDPRRLTDAEWRERLSPEAYRVLRQAGTERPWTGEYVDTKDPGTYRCAACGNDLFDAATKYESGSGWPSFTEAVRPDAVQLEQDHSLGMVRVEVRCARCGSHLGHLFDDGPREAGGLRYCMNSVSLELDRATG